ncbi:rRNA-processing protein CGR1 [Massariosphaeria phaeospora]|uniref:rRNA-processing protein n=1 Tax=Massariosphaeria phaeospora TaxID=100035 RepID=A0A7C8I6D3_9PLEO|nr:rRNA-processing protein CGR1 [Massariosphaeria phaeospora]
MSATIETPDAPTAGAPTVKGMRVNGKQWHQTKTAFRPRAGQQSFEQRALDRKALATVKAKEKEMKDEKATERQRRIDAIRTKRAAKEERARYQKMGEKMHKKRVERLKRREKRNKMLKS